MVVIPQDECLHVNVLSMSTWSSLQQVKESIQDQLCKVEKQHREGEKIGDPYRRLVIQATSLDQMKSLKEQIRNFQQLRPSLIEIAHELSSKALAVLFALMTKVKSTQRIMKWFLVLVWKTINYAVRDRRWNIVL